MFYYFPLNPEICTLIRTDMRKDVRHLHHKQMLIKNSKSQNLAINKDLKTILVFPNELFGGFYIDRKII